MEFSTQKINGFSVVIVTETITMFTLITEVRDYISNLIDQNVLKIAVRFPPNSYFSSRSIAVVVTCNERIRDKGGIFVIIQPNDQILSLLVSLGIEDQFITCADIEDLMHL
jgi:anti-anti-sigma regulatory factor